MNTQKQLINLFDSIDAKRSFINLKNYSGIKKDDFINTSSSIIDLDSIKLIATQHIIDENIIDYYTTQQNFDPAFGVQYEDKIWVLDGHHRLVHWIQLGKNLKMKIIYLI